MQIDSAGSFTEDSKSPQSPFKKYNQGAHLDLSLIPENSNPKSPGKYIDKSKDEDDVKSKLLGYISPSYKPPSTNSSN